MQDNPEQIFLLLGPDLLPVNLVDVVQDRVVIEVVVENLSQRRFVVAGIRRLRHEPGGSTS